MSRSYKHTPITGWCSNGGQRLFRSMENRAFRHRVKQKLIERKYEEIPHAKEYGNEWASPRDGKMHFFDLGTVHFKCCYCRGLWGCIPGISICRCEEYKEEYKKLMRK